MVVRSDARRRYDAARGRLLVLFTELLCRCSGCALARARSASIAARLNSGASDDGLASMVGYFICNVCNMRDAKNTVVFC